MVFLLSAYATMHGQTHIKLKFTIHICNKLRDRRRNSSILDFRSVRCAGCHTDKHLVVGKVRERLSVCKQKHIILIYRSKLQDVNQMELKYQKQKFCSIEKFDDGGNTGKI